MSETPTTGRRRDDGAPRPAGPQSGGEYEFAPVPEGQGSSGTQIALIIIGGTIGFSIFVVAAEIGGSLGLAQAALAFTLGSLVLGIMGATTSYVGARSRLSTYLLTTFAFGQIGAKLANLVVAASLIGWYGVISNTLGAATQQMLLDQFGVEVSLYVTVTAASSLMIIVTLIGFTGIDRLALMLVPLMVLFIGYAAWRASGSTASTLLPAPLYNFQTATSAVIGSYIAGVIIQPDYSRFARSRRGAVWGVFIALGIVFPAILFFSALPSIRSGQTNILEVMALLGLALPAFGLLVLGAWSSNVLCLYSSSLSLATLRRGLNLKLITLACGVVGTAIAFVPIQSYLINFLVGLGIVIPPIGAIYCIDYLLRRRGDAPFERIDAEPAVRWPALAAWAGGALLGFLSYAGTLSLTGVASFDALIGTLVIMLASTLAAAPRRQQQPV